MAITAGKLMLTMMHPEMLFVAHIHQPIVASPAVRVDDAVQGCLTPDRALWLLPGGVRDDFRHFPVAFQDSEDDRFAACSAPLFSTNTACTKIRFIDFTLTG